MKMILNLNNTTRRLVTSQRKLVLDVIKEAQGHIDAKEIYRRANERDSRISLATVYRNLRLFKEIGLIEERNLGQTRCYYEIKRQGEHHHLICQGCGRVTEIDNPQIGKLIEKLQQKNKFRVSKAELCILGYCNECKK
jgi:Fur family ferric uptake transcriptional regulator